MRENLLNILPRSNISYLSWNSFFFKLQGKSFGRFQVLPDHIKTSWLFDILQIFDNPWTISTEQDSSSSGS